jgi:hypothetical protein
MMRGIELGFVYFLMSSTSLSAGEHAGAMTQSFYGYYRRW